MNPQSRTATNKEAYSVPKETHKLFQDGLLNNPLIAPSLPKEIAECAKQIHFEGSDEPSIPINWRFAESISALKGVEAAMVNVLLRRKYGVEAQKAVINTDHAQLFIMSPMLWAIDPSGEAITSTSPKYNQYFPDYNFHDMGLHSKGFYRTSTTNIYRCKDGKYFHLHGSMNADPTLASIGLPPQPDKEYTTPEESYEPFMQAMAKIDSDEMQRLATDVYKQAGTICYTREEYTTTPHAIANSKTGLYKITHIPNPSQPACWWPSTAQTSPHRPLAGLKVIDLTRIIAAPAITRGLAELGASVMRITAPHIADMSMLHCDMNWGKWNCSLDFRSASDGEKFRALVLDADVVVTGYRPAVLDKYGFSPEGLVDICKNRDRGLIVARENCYGWDGEWSSRSGWQQISDACCGVSWEFGQAMGLDEPVTPVFPNSDFCTGVAGVVGVLGALVQRAEKGGGAVVDVSLNAYNTWLTHSCGTYPPKTWSSLHTRYNNPVFRHYHNMQYTLPRMLKMLHQKAGSTLFRPEFFENRFSGAIGMDVRTVRPVVQFEEGGVKLGFNVGTRGNGVDEACWPGDLGVEVVRREDGEDEEDL